jgi:hypothetical protein
VIVEGLLRARPGMKVVPKSGSSASPTATDGEAQAAAKPPAIDEQQPATASLNEDHASEKSQ